jgi:hypothetical protein
VFLTFQEIEGLREVYGEKVAHEITGQCANKVFLRLGSPQTAEWASSFFGEQEWIEVRRSGGQGSSTGTSERGLAERSKQSGTNESSSWTENRVVKKAIPAAQFLELPKAGPGTGFYGYGDFASIGAFSIRPEWDIVEALLPGEGSAAALERRPGEHQYLTQWENDDRARLGLLPSKITQLAVNAQQPRASRLKEIKR